MTASLVVQTSFLGDMVLTTPLIAHLAESAGAPVDVVATPAAAPLLANNPAVREVIVYDKRGADRGVRGFLAHHCRASRARLLAPRISRKVRCAAARSRWPRAFPTRVGFATSAGRAFYTRRLPRTTAFITRRDCSRSARPNPPRR